MKKIICFIAFVMAMFVSACTSAEQQKEMCDTYNDACHTIDKRIGWPHFLYDVKTIDVQCKGWTEKQEVCTTIPTIYGYGKNVHDVRYNSSKAYPSYYTEDGHCCYITEEEYSHLHPTAQRLYIKLYQPYKR